MALEKTGIEFVTEGEEVFTRALDDGSKSLDKFDQTTQETGKGLDAWGEIATGAFRRVGEMAVDSLLNAGKAVLDFAGNVVSAIAGTVIDAFQKAGEIIGDFAKESFKGAIEAEDGMNRLAGAIKRAGDASPVTYQEAIELSQGLKDLAGGSDDAVIAAETVLLRFQGITKETFPQALQASLDLAAALGIDLTSAAQMVGKALEAPGEGLLRLKTAGVVFTDEQKTMIDAMVEAGNTAGAQQLILDQLARTTGGAAADAAKGFGAQWAILKEHVADAGESIMSNLLPALEDLFHKYVEPNLPKLETLANIIGEKVSMGVYDLMHRVEALLPVLKDFWDTYITPNIPRLIEWARWIGEEIPIAIARFQGFIDSARPFIDRLFEAGKRLFDAFMADWPEIQTEVGKVTDSFDERLGNDIPTLLNDLIKLIDTLTVFWQEHGDQIIEIVGDLARAVSFTVGLILAAFDLLINTGIAILSSSWVSTFLKLVTIAENGKLGIVNVIEKLDEDIQLAIANIVGNMIQGGKDWVSGLIRGIGQGADDLNRAIDRLARDALNALKRVLGIGSPSKVAALEVGLPLGQGIADGILASLGDVQASLRGVTVEALASVAPPAMNGGAGGNSYRYGGDTYAPQFGMTVNAGRADAASVTTGFNTLTAIYAAGA